MIDLIKKNCCKGVSVQILFCKEIVKYFKESANGFGNGCVKCCFNLRKFVCVVCMNVVILNNDSKNKEQVLNDDFLLFYKLFK